MPRVIVLDKIKETEMIIKFEGVHKDYQIDP